jgi:hypothetical protein
MPAALGEGVSFEYFILAETFKAEVCQGFDHKTVARVLLDCYRCSLQIEATPPKPTG